MSSRSNSNAAVLLCGQFDGSNDIFLTSRFHDCQGESLWTAMIEHPANTGIFICGGIRRFSPNDLHGGWFDVWVYGKI
jgi:hypothetical protein